MRHPGQLDSLAAFTARMPRFTAYPCTPFFRYVLKALDTAALAEIRLSESPLRQLRVCSAKDMVCTILGVGHES